MATLQVPAGNLARVMGTRMTLASGTLLAGMSGSLLGRCVARAVSGCGSIPQHPLASGAVSRAYGRNVRAPLGVYNFPGDLGKSALPATASPLITVMPWRHALGAMSIIGMLVTPSHRGRPPAACPL
jgi:FSR family fosmidomycin resistance protein-like MFS transporter